MDVFGQTIPIRYGVDNVTITPPDDYQESKANNDLPCDRVVRVATRYDPNARRWDYLVFLGNKEVKRTSDKDTALSYARGYEKPGKPGASS